MSVIGVIRTQIKSSRELFTSVKNCVGRKQFAVTNWLKNMLDEWRLMSVCDYYIQKYLQKKLRSKEGIPQGWRRLLNLYLYS